MLTIEDGVAEALAVLGDTILAVGDEQDVLRHRGEATTVVDLAGGALLPGFIDGHTHMLRSASRLGLTGREAVDLALRYGLTTLVEAANRMPDLEHLLDMETSGDLRVRVAAYGGYNLARPVGEGESTVVATWFPANPPLIDRIACSGLPGSRCLWKAPLATTAGATPLPTLTPQAFQDDPSWRMMASTSGSRQP